jgi:hypothetical protein
MNSIGFERIGFPGGGSTDVETIRPLTCESHAIERYSPARSLGDPQLNSPQYDNTPEPSAPGRAGEPHL